VVSRYCRPVSERLVGGRRLVRAGPRLAQSLRKQIGLRRRKHQLMAKACRTGDPGRQPSYFIPEPLIAAGGQSGLALVRSDVTVNVIGKVAPSSSHSPLWPANWNGFLILIEPEDGPKKFIRVVHGSAEAFAVPILRVSNRAQIIP
jgi:hypothetical protein